MLHKETNLPVDEALTRAKVKLTLKAPFFAFYVNRSNVQLGYKLKGKTVGTASTDGKSIVVNPEYASELTMSELVFLLAHEGAHIGAAHSLRAAKILAKDPETYSRTVFNIAADYLVNHGLTSEGFVMPEKGLLDRLKTPELYTVEKLYKEVFEEQPEPQDSPDGEPQDGSGSASQTSQGESSDKTPGDSGEASEEEDQSEEEDTDPEESEDSESETEPDSEPESDSEPEESEDGDGDTQQDGDSGNGEAEEEEEAEPELNDPFGGVIEATDDTGQRLTQDELDAEMKKAGVELRQAIQAAKAQGKDSGFGEGVIEEISPSHINWRQRLLEFCGRALLKDDFSWRRPNPRYAEFDVTLPSLGRPGLQNLVVACDSSGSVSETGFAEFIQAVDEILEDHPQCEVTLIQCDSEIKHVATAQGETPKDLKRHGYGGTDFKPVFEHVEKLDIKPDALLYFTDLWVSRYSFPEVAPEYPVLWLYARDNNNPEYTERHGLPFGELAEYRNED